MTRRHGSDEDQGNLTNAVEPAWQGFWLWRGAVHLRPVAEGEESVEAGAWEDDASDGNAEVDGWPVLSDLELEVCLADDEVLGVGRPTPLPGQP